LLVGAEFNSELEAAAVDAKLKREKQEAAQGSGEQHPVKPAA
jgi:hypothetical protein